MREKLLKSISVLAAMLVMFVSMGWNVNFHYCTESNHMSGSFGDASKYCAHCANHHHAHMNEKQFAEHLKVIHFGEKCCCEDFSSKIQFNDNFVFSPNKHLSTQLPSFVLPFVIHVVDNDVFSEYIQIFTQIKIPSLPTGRLLLIFFSQLRLDPFIS